MKLVTGGTGIVGSRLLFDLTKAGQQVRATYRSKKSIETTRQAFSHYSGQEFFDLIEWVEGDILDITSLAKAMEGIDEVYHCAALVSFNPKDREKLMQVNVEGTANMVNIALDLEIRKFCHVSSTAAIGKTANGELCNENTIWKLSDQPSHYSVSKYYAEQEVWRATEEGLNAVIVNPCIVIGQGEWGRSSTSFFPQVWKGLKLYSPGGNAFVDVRDVSLSMIRLMDSNISKKRFLVVGENMLYKDFLQMVADALNKPRPSIQAKPWMAEIGWRALKILSLLTASSSIITKETARSAMRKNYFSNEKIQQELDMEFTPISLSVKDTAAAFLNAISPS